MTKSLSRETSKGRWWGLLLVSSVLAAQGQSVSLGAVDVKNTTVVDFQAHVDGSTAITPTCGRSVSERRLLCSGAARLEVKQGSAWVRARPHFEGTVLGGIGTDHKGFLKLDSSQSVDLEFIFSKDFFGLRKGTSLRVAVDVWPSEDAFRTGQAPATVRSEPFLCP